MKHLPDEQLIYKFNQLGDIDSLNRLFSRYLKKTYAYFLNSINNRNDAEDLVQNLFIKLIRKINTGEEIKNFKDYLFSSCQNLCRDYFRQKKASRLMQSSDDSESLFSINLLSVMNWQHSGTEHSTSLSEIETAIKGCLTNFQPEKTKNILRDYVYGYSLKEIAELNDCPVSTAGSIWHRHKGKLMNCVLQKIGDF